MLGEPFTWIEATHSGASSRVFLPIALIGTYGGWSSQSSASKNACSFFTALASRALRFSPFFSCSTQ